MKRASITFSQTLEEKLETYLQGQATPPSLSSLVNTALEEYLDRQAWLERGHIKARGDLNLPVSTADVEPDVSFNHDDYLNAP